VGRKTLAYTPGALKIFVYQPISTKFNAKVTVGTLRTPVVELRGKRVGGEAIREKAGKIMVFHTPDL
jgi:hypothetical protein